MVQQVAVKREFETGLLHATPGKTVTVKPAKMWTNNGEVTFGHRH